MTQPATHAIALSSVGNGAKLHIVDVIEGDAVRFNRPTKVYTQPSVWCGSDRGWGNTAHGVTVLARFDMVEYPDYATEPEAFRVVVDTNNLARGIATVESMKALEQWGDRVCLKCLRDHRKMYDRFLPSVEASLTAMVNEDIQALF